MRFRFWRCAATALVLMLIGRTLTHAADNSTKSTDVAKLPLVLHETFSEGVDRWQPADPKGWKLIDVDGGKAFSLFAQNDVKTPHRSPRNVAIYKDLPVSDCVLEVKVKSTVPEQPHRDVVLVFGYQNPSKFYYVHFASQTDPVAHHQIFIVNDADRKKITEQGSEGVKWDDGWHHLKVVRNVGDGLIAAYFDDMEKPVMTAHDTTIRFGRIGIGSFDDLADFAEVKLSGSKVKPPLNEGIDGPAAAIPR